MKLFMSHHSASKPLVREVTRHLPAHIAPWLDEWELLPGDHLRSSLRDAVTADVDYVVVFLDSRALASDWVRAELAWAREEEARASRTFVLPVVLEDGVIDQEPWLRERIFIRLHGYSEANLRELAQELSTHLFALVSRDLTALRSGPKDATGRLREVDRADALLQELGNRIRTEVFPYRRDHPLPLRDLARRLAQSTDAVGSVDQLREILFKLRDRKLLSGIGVTSSAIFVSEEHLNWRQREALREKRAAAEHVVDTIPDGASIYLDAGSSTLQVARGIAEGLRFGQWHSLKVATMAVPVANVFSDLALELGLEDDDTRLEVVVLGGRMRLNTAALLPPPAEIEQSSFDLAFVGTNGVTFDYGLTTTTPDEAKLKAAAIRSARKAIAFAEPAKYGVWQSESFATVDDDVEIVTACAPADRGKVEEFVAKLSGRPMTVTLIDLPDSAD